MGKIIGKIWNRKKNIHRVISVLITTPTMGVKHGGDMYPHKNILGGIVPPNAKSILNILFILIDSIIENLENYFNATDIKKIGILSECLLEKIYENLSPKMEYLIQEYPELDISLKILLEFFHLNYGSKALQ